MADIIQLLTKLPAPRDPPPAVRDNMVVFFHATTGAARDDKATYIAFNLPIGTVVTVMEHNQKDILPGRNIADLSNCGICVDPVGTGRTEAVNLCDIELNDRCTCFFWRTVDLRLGAIELFRHVNFQGSRSTIFLSEWRMGTLYPLSKWWLQDQISSVRWWTLRDRQTVTLFENITGEGSSYDNIHSWSKKKELLSLTEFKMNDKLSAFRWDGVVPLKEDIKPFTNTPLRSVPVSGLFADKTGKNMTDSEATETITTEIDTQRSTTIETRDEHVASISSTWTSGTEVSAPGVGSFKSSYSVALSYNYKHSTMESKTETKAIKVPITSSFKVPPQGSWICKADIFVGELPSAVYKTKATRWYDVPLTGSVPDPANNNWYRREEDVEVYLSGFAGSSFHMTFETQPL